MLKVDQELKSLIPPLSADEKQQLEENIKTEGCRDSLVIWQGTLIDGHNRHEICERLGINYRTYEIELPDREAVKDWIDKNQLGRRNLTSDWFKYLIGRRYERSKKAIPNPEGANQHAEVGDQNDPQPKTADRIASDHGVSAPTVKRAAKFAQQVDSDPELKQAMAENKPVKEVLKQKKKQQREAEIEQVKQKIEQEPEELHGLFDVIAIDPPWPYGRKYDPETSRVANPYPEMPLEDIQAIDLPLKDDAVVFLWTTHAFLSAAFRLLESWGLAYKATMVWDKEKMGMGATVRMQCEFCLLATTGKPIMQGAGERDIIREARRQHSRKPDGFYAMVDRMCIGRKLDYFSREGREGWSAWGAENGKF